MHDTNVLGSMIKSFLSIKLFRNDEEGSTAYISLGMFVIKVVFNHFVTTDYNNRLLTT